MATFEGSKHFKRSYIFFSAIVSLQLQLLLRCLELKGRKKAISSYLVKVVKSLAMLEKEPGMNDAQAKLSPTVPTLKSETLTLVNAGFSAAIWNANGNVIMEFAILYPHYSIWYTFMKSSWQEASTQWDY